MPGLFLSMPLWAILAVSAVASYFLGCFNGAVIVSKYILRDDVRTHGSGNAGLTNFYRTFGGPLTAVVILADVVKAVLAVLLTQWLVFHGYTIVISAAETVETWDAIAKYWAGVFCLVGHMFPVMFKFKGGKGILSGGTIAWMIDWRVALVVWGGFLILSVLTRYVSLGSCWAGLSFPFASWFVFHNYMILLLSILCGGLILWQHRGNIRRLLTGTESKFHFRKKQE